MDNMDANVIFTDAWAPLDKAEEEKERGIDAYYAERETDEERDLKLYSTACRMALER